MVRNNGDGESQNENQSLYHPILYELNLIKREKSEMVSITTLDILNRLLHTKVLSIIAVREAYAAVLDSEKPIAAENRQGQRGNETLESNISCPAKHGKEVGSSQIATKPTHRTRHIALRFYYDGAKYNGLAQNVGNDKDQSVEKALFQALTKSRLVESREASGYSRCGRTDRGVSAAGQVVAFQNMKSAIPIDATFDLEGKEKIMSDQLPNNSITEVTAWVLPNKKDKKRKQKNSNTDLDQQYVEDEPKVNVPARQQKQLREYPYANILNNLLPSDIRILGWCPVSDDFSARFSATTRTYRYFFVPRQMDMAKIQEGLKLLVGKHDFRNFCKMDVEKVYNFERLVHSAELKQVTPSSSGMDLGICYIQIVGQAFLWHQIRYIVSVLFMIGNGLEPPSVITDLCDIERFPGKPSYQLAPEHPLVLHDCGYPHLRVGHSVQNIWSVCCHLEKQWEDLILTGARLRNCIQYLEDASIRSDDLVQFATSKVKERQKKQKRFAAKGSNNSNQILGSPEAMDFDISALCSDGATKDKNGAFFLSWKEALPWLERRGLIPDSNGLRITSYHIPLLQRSMGPTYEEKIGSLLKSDKRKQRYEENVIKKRKTAAEDAAFYEHMTRQGGTGM